MTDTHVPLRLSDAPRADDGHYGPHSVSWRVFSDPASGLGAKNALFLQMLQRVFLGERPEWPTWIGAATVVGSGLYALARERRVSQPRASRYSGAERTDRRRP